MMLVKEHALEYLPFWHLIEVCSDSTGRFVSMELFILRNKKPSCVQRPTLWCYLWWWQRSRGSERARIVAYSKSACVRVCVCTSGFLCVSAPCWYVVLSEFSSFCPFLSNRVTMFPYACDIWPEAVYTRRPTRIGPFQRVWEVGRWCSRQPIGEAIYIKADAASNIVYPLVSGLCQSATGFMCCLSFVGTMQGVCIHVEERE